MYRYGRGIRFLNTMTRNNKGIWDPIISLEFNHPSLLLLEKINSRDHFKQILGQTMRNNLIGQTFPMSRLILFSAISHPENLDIALILFNYYTPKPNLYIYNTMTSALSSATIQSFSVYYSMLSTGIDPDKHTLLYLLNSARHVSEVKQLHCHAIVFGLATYRYLQNSLIKKYIEKGLFWLACKIFQKMPSPDVVSFNIMITGCAKQGLALEAIKLLHDMIALDLKPDEFTMLGILVSCGKLGMARLGKAVHGWIERRKSITSSNLILGNALLHMYIQCHELDLASRIFSALKKKDIVSWNTIIGGCAKAGAMGLARSLFDKMPCRDLVSWNSLIAGYATQGDFIMLRNLLNDMVVENVMPDSVTVASVISAAAEIGALDLGRWGHGWIIRMQIKIDALLGSALIDMYCKCGNMDKAFFIFDQIMEKDVIAWTTMITGCACHGYGSKALELFSKMQADVTPNEVTFVSILTACSHSGLVDQGIKTFSSMKQYGIEPRIEHYGCLVDLLGRSGRLAEAKNVIERMNVKPSRSIWGSILNACQAHGDTEMAEIASAELLKLEPQEEGGYMLLSNIYAANERWGYSDKIRQTMDRRGVKKTAGFSSLVSNLSHSSITSGCG